MTANEIILAHSFGMRDFSEENLRDADLRDSDLSGADLSRAKLSGADLRGAKLHGAKLSRADLSRAKLRDADLSRADLSDADLRWAYLSRAKLRDADLSRADLRGAKLYGAKLNRADLSDADLSGSDLDLSGANFPSPAMFLLANWGEVSDWLCAALMRYDASNHDNPQKFLDWKNIGSCPYSEEKYQRSANFKENKELFSMDAPLLSARQLMQCLLFEKCKYYD